MENIREINAHFSKDSKYFENNLGTEFHFTQSTGPYEYLLGALAGCYFYTLQSILENCSFENVHIDVVGKKRENVPTTLEETSLKIVAKGVSDKKKFKLAAERASEECSIFQTISKVSKMDLEIVFED